MIRQAFGEESMKRVQRGMNDVLDSGQTEKSEAYVEQSQEHAHQFL
jgi:hypothetical protein